jgi:hypothetical protein
LGLQRVLGTEILAPAGAKQCEVVECMGNTEREELPKQSAVTDIAINEREWNAQSLGEICIAGGLKYVFLNKIKSVGYLNVTQRTLTKP